MLRIPIVAVEVLEHMCNIIAPPVVSVRSNIAEKALVDWLLVGEHVVVLNDDKVLVLAVLDVGVALGDESIRRSTRDIAGQVVPVDILTSAATGELKPNEAGFVLVGWEMMDR